MTQIQNKVRGLPVSLALLLLVFCCQSLAGGELLDKARALKDSAKYAWNQKGALKQHMGNAFQAFKDVLAEKDLLGKFSEKVVQISSAVKQIVQGGISATTLSLVKGTIDSIDFLARNFGKVYNKCTNLYQKYKPDLQYFQAFQKGLTEKASPAFQNAGQVKPGTAGSPAGGFFENQSANSFFTPGASVPVSYDAAAQNQSAAGNTLFTDDRENKFTGAVGLSGAMAFVCKDPLNVFRFGKMKDAYQEAKLGGKIGYQVSAFTENVIRGVVGMQEQIKELTDSRGFLNNLLGSFLNGNAAAGLNSLGAKATDLKNRSLSILSSIKLYVPRIVQTYHEYTGKYGDPISRIANQFSSSGSSSNQDSYKLPVVGQPEALQGGIGDAPLPTLREAHERYNSVFQNYRNLATHPNTPRAELERALEEVRRAKAVYQTLLSRE